MWALSVLSCILALAASRHHHKFPSTKAGCLCASHCKFGNTNFEDQRGLREPWCETQPTCDTPWDVCVDPCSSQDLETPCRPLLGPGEGKCILGKTGRPLCVPENRMCQPHELRRLGEFPGCPHSFSDFFTIHSLCTCLLNLPLPVLDHLHCKLTPDTNLLIDYLDTCKSPCACRDRWKHHGMDYSGCTRLPPPPSLPEKGAPPPPLPLELCKPANYNACLEKNPSVQVALPHKMVQCQVYIPAPKEFQTGQNGGQGGPPGPRPTESPADDTEESDNSLLIAIIVILVFLVVMVTGSWFFWCRYENQRHTQQLLALERQVGDLRKSQLASQTLIRNQSLNSSPLAREHTTDGKEAEPFVSPVLPQSRRQGESSFLVSEKRVPESVAASELDEHRLYSNVKVANPDIPIPKGENEVFIGVEDGLGPTPVGNNAPVTDDPNEFVGMAEITAGNEGEML